MKRTLDHVLFIEHHIVAQIIEAELIIRAVGDVRLISFTFLFFRQAVDIEPNCQAEPVIQFAHFFGIAARQVFVDCHDMDAFFRDGIQIDGHRRSQGFTFTGLHFGNIPLMKRCSSHDLHTEWIHSKYALRCFAHRSKCFRHHVIERLALFIA